MSNGSKLSLQELEYLIAWLTRQNSNATENVHYGRVVMYLTHLKSIYELTAEYIKHGDFQAR